MPFDVVIVGAGPAGLAAAIRLRQRATEQGEDLSVCVLEKGSEVGAHILSGAIVEPRALDELLPDWREQGAPLNTPARKDRFLWLTRRRAIPLMAPPQMHNKGNYIVSLGNLCRWLARQAEALGVEILPGFPAAEILYDDQGAVRGVATADMGRNPDGSEGLRFEPGVELHARQTLFCEGCHGSLAKQLMTRFDLRRDCDPQTYGLGIKELWEVDSPLHEPGRVVHTVGWPLDNGTYGGSFLYHLDERRVAVGLIVGLDYANPYLSPFEEMQRFKTHPAIRPLFEGGRRIAYGARALVEGGWQSLPRLSFPGGFIAGDSSGFLNVPKIKGTHNAMKSGMTAAEAILDRLRGEAPEGTDADDLRQRLEATWVMRELRRARNIRPAFRRGLWPGITLSAMDTYLLRGRAPWTLHHREDHAQLRPAAVSRPIDYPRPDGRITFDRLASVFLSNTHHEEGQPVHLKLRDATKPTALNLPVYDGPEARYCPAGVYEYVDNGNGGQRLQINAQNCVHCKTCDIKDPGQNIDWCVPQGGDGPNYPDL
ncbi:electron transfer flavoprotein-ubiquinone oxidoreductase [Ectothiorhodospira mobilis]|nr:electron transfer flavoprotein-ubiquinone oxidoreductase [Ectothiorhodospira mobilis]MBK1692356.1 electron transfer flavoprotein-ubiquinone oxidoreductase [Ectothiorhodospira mobilis]